MLIESETNNNPITVPSPITLSTLADPATVVREKIHMLYISLMDTENEQSVNTYSNTCVC